MSKKIALMDRWLELPKDEVYEEYTPWKNKRPKPKPVIPDRWEQYRENVNVVKQSKPQNYFEMIKQERELEKIKLPIILERIDWNKFKKKEPMLEMPNSLMGANSVWKGYRKVSCI